MRALAVSLLAVSSLLLTTTSAPAADPSPARKLVYSFERTIDEAQGANAQPSPQGWQQQSDVQKTPQRQNQQFDAPAEPGAGHASASSSSSGTIEVDVLRAQTDGGLVVAIHEQPGTEATPVTCVVYPNTSLTCAATSMNPEELALLRFLGHGFVDPLHMDSQRRWHVAQSGGGLDANADYQIVNAAGSALTIDETQTIGSKAGAGATIRSTIGYDLDRSLPTSIDEHVVQNQQAGTQTSDRTVHTVLRLVSVTP